MVKIGNKEILIGVILVLLLFSFTLFGFTGVKVIAGSIILFFIPFYLILDKLDIETDEKIVFSFFIGIGIFSTFVYYLGILFNSIRIAIIVTLVILITTGFFLRRLKKKR